MVGKLFGHPVHQDAAFNRNRRCRFFYMLGGLALLITRRLWGTVLSLVFIGAEVLGRVYLLQTGAAPRSGADSLKIFVGGVIAVGFMLYISLRSFKWR
jgi:hypothetical protein